VSPRSRRALEALSGGHHHVRVGRSSSDPIDRTAVCHLLFARAEHQSDPKNTKIDIANEIKHSMFSSGAAHTHTHTLVSTQRHTHTHSVFGTDSLDQLCKYILPCFITGDYLHSFVCEINRGSGVPEGIEPTALQPVVRSHSLQ